MQTIDLRAYILMITKLYEGKGEKNMEKDVEKTKKNDLTENGKNKNKEMKAEKKNNKENKEKKKMKLWKKILIVIAVILLIFIAIVLRKFIILNDIDNKVSEYENNQNNIYSKVVSTISEHTIQVECYIKDDIIKYVFEKTDKDGTKTRLIQITYPHERKLYAEDSNTKVMRVYKEEAPVRGSHIETEAPATISTIANFAYSMSIPERIINSICTSIKSVEVNGKECYELSNVFGSNYMESKDVKIMAYAEKETGLPVKYIEIVNENGQEVENVTEYEYKFNCVTDEDLAEPDESQYELQE